MTTPKKIVGKMNPAYVWAHGGGGYAGTALEHEPLIGKMAVNLNCTVFNVDYRLGPEVKCPKG